MEFELKFQVPPERRDGVAAALRRGTTTSTRLQARYFDTPGRALATARAALRLRREGRRWIQAAKAQAPGTFARLEHEVAVSASRDSVPDIKMHDAEAVGERLRAALAATHESAADLALRFETDVVRLTRTVEAGGATIEIAFDEGMLRAGGRTHPIREVEFELKAGPASALVAFAAGWCAEHGLWLDLLSKAQAGERLAEGRDHDPARRACELARDPASTAAWLADALGGALDQVLWNAREIAAATNDDEHVHQLRVGLRRLRTALRELGRLPELEDVATAAEPALTELFRVLGEHRDAATLVPKLQAQLEAAGDPARPWQPALPPIASAVRSAEAQAAFLHLVGWQVRASQGEMVETTPLEDARAHVSRHLHKLHKNTFDEGSGFVALSEPKRHGVRKRLKRLRYLAELAAPLYAARKVAHYVEGLKALQDALGEYQDAAAGRGLWQVHAGEDARASFGVGWLTAREEEIARECERACRASAAEAKPFWS